MKLSIQTDDGDELGSLSLGKQTGIVSFTFPSGTATATYTLTGAKITSGVAVAVYVGGLKQLGSSFSVELIDGDTVITLSAAASPEDVEIIV